MLGKSQREDHYKVYEKHTQRMELRNETFCVPKISHNGRLEDAWRLDHNTGTRFLQGHNQENNITKSQVEVWCIHVVEEEQSRHNKKSCVRCSLGVCQTTVHKVFGLE